MTGTLLQLYEKLGLADPVAFALNQLELHQIAQVDRFPECTRHIGATTWMIVNALHQIVRDPKCRGVFFLAPTMNDKVRLRDLFVDLCQRLAPDFTLGASLRWLEIRPNANDPRVCRASFACGLAPGVGWDAVYDDAAWHDDFLVQLCDPYFRVRQVAPNPESDDDVRYAAYDPRGHYVLDLTPKGAADLAASLTYGPCITVLSAPGPHRGPFEDDGALTWEGVYPQIRSAGAARGSLATMKALQDIADTVMAHGGSSLDTQ